jgi:hypothetical protein
LLGLADGFNARAVVCADFDDDGDIDILLLTNKPGNSGVLWHNSSAAAGNGFLRVKLVGAGRNTEAAGARIFLTIDTRTQMREIIVGSNYTSQNPTLQVFGLGNATVINELRVEWPALVSGAAEPAQTDEWVGTGLAPGMIGETLVICHPELVPIPPELDCAVPD